MSFESMPIDIPLSPPPAGGLKNETHLRQKYLRQVDQIKKQVGDLEDIRMHLGLSQRKMCQLLMVDPSAWTRWNKSGEAPPHIYRALQWYLALQEKLPGLSNEFWLATIGNTAAANGKIEELENQKMALWKAIKEQKEHLHLLLDQQLSLKHQLEQRLDLQTSVTGASRQIDVQHPSVSDSERMKLRPPWLIRSLVLMLFLQSLIIVALLLS